MSRLARDQARALEALDRAHRRRNRAPSSLRVLASTTRVFLAHVRKPVAEVEGGDVVGFLAAREAAGVASSTQENDLYQLRTVFRALRAEGLVVADPTEGLTVRGRRDRRPVLGERTVAALLGAALKPSPRTQPRRLAEPLALRDRAALELLYGAGLRASEVCAVRVVDLHLAEAALRVRRAKGGESRLLLLPAAAVPHLRRYLVEGRARLREDGADRDDGRFLLSCRGHPLTPGVLQSLLRRVGRRVGVATHPHALRHALATHLVRAGVHVRAVQLLLGHARLDTTAVYLGVDPAELRAAVESLDLGVRRGA